MQKLAGELIFRWKQTKNNLSLMQNWENSHKTLKNIKWARKCIQLDVLLWDKEIPPSDPNTYVRNSAKPRFWRIILVLGWDFLSHNKTNKV